MFTAIALALAVSAAPKAAPAPKGPTRLVIEVKPASAVVFIDGKKHGTGKKPFTLTVTPGRHKVEVRNNKDSVEDFVVAKKGETTHWQWAFEDDGEPRKKKGEPASDEGEATGAPATPSPPPEAAPALPPEPAPKSKDTPPDEPKEP